jgi:triosephosphate isomerase (TIM)
MRDDVRRPIVGGNWKMNTTLPTAVELAERVERRIGDVPGIDVVLFPPYPNLESVHQAIDGSTLQLGAQNVFWEETGAFTGEVSAPMLTAVGCSWVIVGHSERRRILGESSEVVNKKLHAALRNGLQVILAVGETGGERRAGQTEMVIEQQLRESLASVGDGDMTRVVVAYEPVWAIGTGETATPAQAREAHAFVRGVLEKIYNPELAEATRIQYGGSVTARNAADLMAEPGIDGALVGGASLKPDEFAAIALASAPEQGSS